MAKAPKIQYPSNAFQPEEDIVSMMSIFPQGQQLLKGISEVYNSLEGDDRNEFNNLMESAFHSISADLKAEDRGWIRLSMDARGPSMTTYLNQIEQCRIYSRFDSNCKQIVNLYVNFGVGIGFNWRASEKKYDRQITKYWKNKRNRRVFSTEGQRTTARRLAVDGSVFFAHFGEGANTITRRIDTLQIINLLVDPDDELRVVGYKRKVPDGKGGFVEQYLADWDNLDLEAGIEKFVNMDGTQRLVSNYVPDLLVQRVVFEPDEFDLGSSVLTTSVVWAKIHRHFMRCRAAVMQTIAMFARKIKAKAGQNAINNLLNTFSVTSEDSNSIHGPNIPPGSTWLENQAIDLQPTSQETGAEAARVDGSMLIQSIGVGAGIFPHYLGSGDSFRLATAGAMEPPMVKAFQSFQQLLIDEYYYMMEFMINGSDVRKNLDLDFPVVETKDISKFLHAVNEVANTFPKLKQSPDYVKFLLTQLGFRNVEEVFDRYEKIEEDKPEASQFDQGNKSEGPEAKIPAGNAQITNLPSARKGKDSR